MPTATIKPRIPTGFEDLVVKMITFGVKGNVHVHILREGKDETWKYTKAKMFFPQALGEYIVENQLVILKGMEWATAYGLPKTPFYPPGTFGKPCDTNLSKQDRLWVRMNQVTRLGNQQQGIHNSAIKRACATQKRHKLQGKHYSLTATQMNKMKYADAEPLSMTIDGQPATVEAIDRLVQEYQAMDLHTQPNSHHEVALIDSACDTSAIGGHAWIIDEHTGKQIDVTGHTQHATARRGIPIVCATTATDLPNGETILLKLNETSNLGEHGNTLLSTIQLREHGVEISDVPRRHGGDPYIMADGYVIPLELHEGILQFKIRHPTDHELATCYEVVLTSDQPWEPHALTDSEMTSDDYEDLCNNIPNLEDIRRLQLLWSRARPQDVKMAEPYLLYPGEQTT